MERTWSVGLRADRIDVLWISDCRGSCCWERVAYLKEFGLIDINYSEVMRLRLIVDVHDVVTGIVDLKNEGEVWGGRFTTVSFDRMCGYHRALSAGLSNGEVQLLRTLSVYG